MRVRSASLALAAALTVAVATTSGCSPSREEPSTLTGSPTGTAAASSPVGEQPATGTTAAPTAPTTAAAPQPGQQVIAVTVRNGAVSPAPAAVDVKLGSTVVIEVTADVADEVHVHGYDVIQPVSPGQPSRLEVRADRPGQFEVELESAHLLLVRLRVQ